MQLGACWCNGKCPHEAPQALVDKHMNGKAELALRQILLDSPMCIRANEMIATLMSVSNRAQFALKHLARAEGDPNRLRYLLIAGWVQRRALEFDAAKQSFEMALAIDSKSAEAFSGLIAVLEAQGDLEKARDMADVALQVAGESAPRELRRIIATVDARSGSSLDAIASLPVQNLNPAELFDRGRYREKNGDTDDAWSDWMEAKRLLRDRGGHRWKRKFFEDMIGGLTEITTDYRMRLLSDVSAWTEPKTRPLFITGFPRSGTTLIEQVLSSHSAVDAGDELQFIPELVQMAPAILRARSPYPRALMALAMADNQAAVPMMRAHYLYNAARKTGSIGLGGEPFWGSQNVPKMFFTDKMPLNEMHLPLIRILFPHCPVIYCRRHPLDIIVSNMSHYITHGWFAGADLESCARSYAMIDGLLMHYRRKFPGAIREVRYEAFVAAPKLQTELLLNDIGLPIEAECFAPHENKRPSRTISYAQIQEPIHTKAVARYKPFLKFLEPILPIVRPICEREGYEI